MTQAAPLLINPRLFAEQQAHFHGEIPLQQLPRLANVLENQQGYLTYDLQFQQDEEQQVLITLTWEAQVPVVCQRCLQIFECPLQRTTQLQPLTDEMKLTALADEVEPITLDPETHSFHLLELLADEVILQVPAFPKHPAAECNVELKTQAPDKQTTERQKPFAQLAELLHKKNK